MLVERGYNLFATHGSARFLEDNEVPVTALYWPDEDGTPNTLEYLKSRKIDLVINIPKNLSKTELYNDYEIRRAAVDFNIPLITNARLASAFIYAICKLQPEDIAILSWDEY
jgi:carbamoyl-phosphate synthase large subunit